MIANTTAFRQWSGVTWTVAEARTHVHQDRLPEPRSNADQYEADPLAARFPMAIVWTDPNGGWEYTVEAIDGSPSFDISGHLVAQFFRLPSSEELADGVEDETFRNTLGAIVTSGDTDNPGLIELQNPAAGFTYSGAGALNIYQVRLSGPMLSAPQWFRELGECQHAMLEIWYRS